MLTATDSPAPHTDTQTTTTELTTDRAAQAVPQRLRRNQNIPLKHWLQLPAVQKDAAEFVTLSHPDPPTRMPQTF